MILKLTEVVCQMKNKKKYLIGLWKKGLMNLLVYKLVYKYKTGVNEPNGFRKMVI